MLFNKYKKIFVGERYDTKTVSWQMPQGGVDDGEDYREAMLRELGEEVGISDDKVEIIAQSKGLYKYNIPKEIYTNLWEGKYVGQEQRWFLLKFTGIDTDINIHTENPEFKSWKWIGFDQLIDMIIYFKRDMYKGIVKEFSPLIFKHFNET